MKPKAIVVLLSAVGLIVLTGSFLVLKDRDAQSPVPGLVRLGPSSGAPPIGGAPFGGGPGGPGDMEKSHQYGLQLMRLVGNIGRLEESGIDPLTAGQAKGILAIIEPLRKQDSLDEPAAKDAIRELQAVLTDKQRSAITAMPAEHQFRRGGPPPGGAPPGGSPSGPPPGMGPRPMGGFNPLNPPPGGPQGGQGPAGSDKLLDALRQKAGAG